MPVPTATPVAAKKNRRRRRLRERARARCLAACGPECAACFHTPNDEILCGDEATVAAGCPFCESDADCGGSLRCVEKEQDRGHYRQDRFTTCLYPDGLCVEIAACEPE